PFLAGQSREAGGIGLSGLLATGQPDQRYRVDQLGLRREILAEVRVVLVERGDLMPHMVRDALSILPRTDPQRRVTMPQHVRRCSLRCCLCPSTLTAPLVIVVLRPALPVRGLEDVVIRPTLGRPAPSD